MDQIQRILTDAINDGIVKMVPTKGLEPSPA